MVKFNNIRLCAGVKENNSWTGIFIMTSYYGIMRNMAKPPWMILFWENHLCNQMCGRYAVQIKAEEDPGANQQMLLSVVARLLQMWAVVVSNVGYGGYHVPCHRCGGLLPWPLTFECIISIVLDLPDENAMVPMGYNGPNQPKVCTHFSRLKGPKVGSDPFPPTLGRPLWGSFPANPRLSSTVFLSGLP